MTDGIERMEDELMIVSLSDIHGYLNRARSALSTVGEYGLPPVVEEDDDGSLHWAGNDYVLVFNGDMIDRGPSSHETMETVRRLREEAPDDRVVYTLGNHEMALAMPHVRGLGSTGYWATARSFEDERLQQDLEEYMWRREEYTHEEAGAENRGQFLQELSEGEVRAAFDGYSFTYVHAGQNEPFDTGRMNELLAEAGDALYEGFVDDSWEAAQRSVVVREPYDTLFDTGTLGSRGPKAGLAWMDYSHMRDDAPPQVVGHTRDAANPQQRGDVINENTIRTAEERGYGEAVVVEEPDEVYALVRGEDGAVDRKDLVLP